MKNAHTAAQQWRSQLGQWTVSDIWVTERNGSRAGNYSSEGVRLLGKLTDLGLRRKVKRLKWTKPGSV